MKRIKFFCDPVFGVKEYLNRMAEQGYRLIQVHGFLYDFQRTDKRRFYETQFVGGSSHRDINGYVDMLRQSGKKIFRAPLNQGNIALGKLRLRPFAGGSGKISNTFMDYNKEILIVESDREEPLLTDHRDVAEHYRVVRNAYLQGLLVELVLLAVSVWQLSGGRAAPPAFLGALLAAALLWTGYLTCRNHRNHKKYLRLSSIGER